MRPLFITYINFAKKKVVLLCLFVLCAFGAFAQQPITDTKGKITGRIIDSATGQPVEYASISLALQGEDKEINGMMTDEKGAFVLNNIADGTYKLSIFSIGYKQGVKNNIVITKTSTTVNLADIKLVNASSKLAEVTVSANKNTVEYKIDKTVYNVDKDITSQTGVATDVLKKIPEIEVDVDGNIELQGNADIRFLINGKPSTIFGNNLADVLQSIPANQIQSIEVITSPGAKYDAAGTAGIINIILKKSTAQGINGNISLSGGTRLENGSFNLNARKGKFGAHAFFSDNAQLSSTILTSSNRTGQNSDTTTKLIQNGTSEYNRNGYQSGVGFDWEPTSKDNFNGDVNYNYFGKNNNGIADRETILQDPLGNIFSNENDLVTTPSNFYARFLDWDASYKRTFNKKDQELDIGVNSSTASGASYYLQTQEHLSNDSIFNSSYGNNPGSTREIDANIDYVQPIGNNGVSIETGVKGTMEEIVSTSDVYLLDPAADLYNYSSTQSSALDYKDNVYAGYLSGSFKFFNWLDMKAGGRYEYTQINAMYSTFSGNVYIQPYGTFVPSITLSHKFSDNQIIKISYTRRIQRPDYFSLNPFVNASDPKNLTTGNPGLEPEIGDKIELSYNKVLPKGGNMNITLFYRENTHDIQPYTTYYPTYKVGDSTYTNVTLTEPENIGQEQNIGFNLFGSVPIKKKVNLRSNVSLYQRYIYTGFSTGGNVSGFNYRINLNGTYEITKTLTFEAFGNFNSPRVNAQGTYPAFFSYSFALRKQLFNEKASLAITANNPFNYYVNQTTNLTGENFTLLTTRALPYQSFGINFTYKFGKLEFKNDAPEDTNVNTPPEN